MAKQTHELTEAMSYIITSQPFIAVLLLDLMKVQETTSVPTAATDEETIFVNPEWFGKLTVQERGFVIAHEVLHTVYQHITRSKEWQDRGVGPDFKPYSHGKMNRATDYIINATLAESNIGSMPHGGLHHPNYSSADNAEDVYCKLPDEDEDNPPPGGGNPGGGFDEHLPPSQNATGRSNAEVQQAVTSAANAAKAQGDLPAGLSRLVGEIVDPKQDWREVLRDFMVTALGKDEPTWSRLNRRRLAMPPHIAFPGTQGAKCGAVAVVVDTSGSIGQEELQLFLSEVQGIIDDANPEECKLLWVDSEVAGVDEIDEFTSLLDLTPKGGGGTDMEAAWPVIEDEFPAGVECVVVLTDMYTSFEHEPTWPVLWAATSDREAPYGKTIRLEA